MLRVLGHVLRHRLETRRVLLLCGTLVRMPVPHALRVRGCQMTAVRRQLRDGLRSRSSAERVRRGRAATVLVGRDAR